MSNAVEQHIPCPKPNCGSSDGYTIYDDGHGWCYSCNTGTWPEEYKPESFERKFVDGFRSIPKKICEKFGIYSYVDAKDEVHFREYVYPEGSKFRRVKDKNFYVKGKVPGLGGTELWNAGSSHYITVVEGEEDAAAAFWMLSKGKTTFEPVVWLTSASIPNKDRDSIYKYLSSFETVKLCFEGDKAGKAAKELLCQMLPNKIKEVPLTKFKDANDYLIHDEITEFKRAWSNAKVYTPDNIYHTEHDIKTVLDDTVAESYYETLSPQLNETIKGIPKNHVTLIDGFEGLGKTEVLRALEVDALREGKRIAVLHQEETKATTFKALACYALSKNCRDPDNPVPNDEILQAISAQTDGFENLFVFEFKRDPTVEEIISQFNYLVYVCGVEYIFIDPINQFDPVDDQTKVQFLDSLSKKVEKYVSSNDVGVVWTAHVDDEGRTRDSRMIAKACSIRLKLTRDLEAETEQERNVSTIRVIKNRPFAKTGHGCNLFFNTDSFTMEATSMKNTSGEIPF